MKRVELQSLFAEPARYTQEPVTVCGWVRTLRTGKSLGFIELNDGSYFSNLQVVFEADKIANFDEISRQNVGAALIVTGQLLLTPQAKQPFEIHAAEITVEGASTPDYPLQKKRHTMEFLRTIQHLRPRTNTFSAAFRVRSVAAQGIHQFFTERGFVYAHTPLITGSDCEGAGEMFRVTTIDPEDPPRTEDGKVDYSQDFFGKATNLTVSGQLEGECMAMAFGTIYLAVATGDQFKFLYGTFGLLVIVASVKFLPFASRSGVNSMLQIAPEIEEAAIIFGVPWRTRMTRILFPIQKSSILSGYLLPVISVMREVALFTLLVPYARYLLTTMLFSFNETGYAQYGSAVTLLIILIIMLINAITNKLTGASFDKGIGG